MDAHGQTSAQLRAAIVGDAASLGWLVTRLSPWLIAQVRWRLGSSLAGAFDPEDLVQDAWLIALPRLGDLVPRDGRVTPVLLRFLTTTMLQRINNLAKARLRQTGAAPVPTVRVEALSAQVTGVVTAAIRDEQRHLVLAAIEGLDPTDRDVLLLRGVEQRSQQTTADLLGIGIDAVAMRYGRARERLRARLPDLLDEFD
ncbi:MAG: sigma-70 family RNA polymerase sigma factor [Planctomycetota bacterium]